MYYALVHFLEMYPVTIDTFRQKYDPRAEVIKPHLTFIFPIEAGIDEQTITTHIEKIAARTKSFQYTLKGIISSWDDVVFLTVSEGKDKILQLHKDLYSNELENFLRKDIEFIPHITLGELNKNKEKVLKEAENLNINFTVKLSKLTLITREHKMAEASSTKEFLLQDD